MTGERIQEVLLEGERVLKTLLRDEKAQKIRISPEKLQNPPKVRRDKGGKYSTDIGSIAKKLEYRKPF